MTYTQPPRAPELTLLEVHLRRKHGGAEKYSCSVFTKDDMVWGTGWFFEAVKAIADSSSRAAPINAHVVPHLKAVLPRIKHLKEWRVLQKTSPEKITAKAVLELFRIVENQYPLTVSTAINSQLISFRAVVRDALRATGQFSESTKLDKKHKKSLSVVQKGRGTISDMLDSHSPIPEPISALNHSSPKDLITRSMLKREATIERLKTSCSACFERFKNECAWIEAVRTMDISPETISKLSLLIGTPQRTNDKRRQFAYDYPTEIKLSALIQSVSNEPCIITREEQSNYRPIFFDDVQRLIFEKIHGIRQGFWQVITHKHIGNTEILYACILTIQIRTAWNISSVLELRKSNILQLEGGVLIQGAKGKTEDKTPPYLVSRQDKDAVFAVNFLLTRHDYLNRSGVIVNDDRLFINYYTGKMYLSWGLVIKNFQKYNNLPLYTSEQVRNEILAYESAKAGPIAAARMAGHANMAVISTYSEDHSQKELNSALNLQFQKSLAADIEKQTAYSAHRERLWPTLRNIGDGASCSNPEIPPDMDWLDGNVCKAENCHANHGCPNRKIIITITTMREVALTVAYYKISWGRLMSENPARFEKVHLPRIVFSRILEQVCTSGPYAARYAQVKTTIDKELS